MIHVLKIHSQFSKYTTGKLDVTWKTPISFGSTDGCWPLPRFCIYFKRIYSEHPWWLLLKHKNGIFNKRNTNDNKCDNDTNGDNNNNDNNNDNDNYNNNNNDNTDNEIRIKITVIHIFVIVNNSLVPYNTWCLKFNLSVRLNISMV